MTIEILSESRKRDIYRQAVGELHELINEGLDAVAAMATCASVLHHALPQSSWTGFYRVVAPELLRIGPYQGPVGCLEIPFEQGVCGAAASQRQTQVIDDVHAFSGHIVCDPETRSEIVVPIFRQDDELVAVLDLDSHQPGSFDQVDRVELERLFGGLQQRIAWKS